MRVIVLGICLTLCVAAEATAQPRLVSATLPGTRAVETGQPATLFAALINAGDATAKNCAIAIDAAYSGPVDAVLGYQTADAANQLTGTPDTPVDIAPGATQNFLISLTPTADFAETEIGFRFACDGARSPVTPGVNTLFLTARSGAGPDLIPIAASPSADGVMRGNRAGGRAVAATAAVNIGAAADVRVSADTGLYAWPLGLTVCETDAGGTCLAEASETLDVRFEADQTRTFTVFARGEDRLGTPLLPDLARVFLRFSDAADDPIGATSLAVTFPEPAFDPSPLALDGAAAWAEASGARALLIQRDGETLYEAYWGLGAVDRAEVLNSGTKSLSCLAQGLAIDRGLFNPDEFAHVGIADWAPGGADPQSWAKRFIRGRDLLSLAHGLISPPSANLRTIDSYPEALDATALYFADRHALYGRVGFQAFAALFELRTGGSFNAEGDIEGGIDPADLITSAVLDRIGATVIFGRDSENKPNFSSGAQATARDWALFGRLILNDGRWDGRRVLSPSSVRRCLHYATDAYLGYGQSFWLNRPVGDSYQENRDSLPPGVRFNMPTTGQVLPNAPADLVSALGANNMQMHLIPSERLVIVKYGGTGQQDDFFATLFSGRFGG